MLRIDSGAAQLGDAEWQLLDLKQQRKSVDTPS